MSGAVLVAVAAAVGNLLQGWDNATIAGAVLYIKKEFQLETQPTHRRTHCGPCLSLELP
ncbi:unnamed protein product [Rhodiola kirilowii]